MKTAFLKLSLIGCALLSVPAFGTIPSEFRRMGASDCVPQTVQSQSSDGVVRVVDALRCDTLYSDVQLLEIVVENRSYHKEIYIYDWAEGYDFDRAVAVRFVSGRQQFDFRDGAALHLGQSPEGHDRFLVSLVSSFRPLPAAAVDIYVKMDGRQYQATSVKLVR